jgi:hypothetical protein
MKNIFKRPNVILAIHILAIIGLLGLYLLNNSPSQWSIPSGYPHGIFHCLRTEIINKSILWVNSEYYIDIIDINTIKLTYKKPSGIIGYSSWSYDVKQKKLTFSGLNTEEFIFIEPNELINGTFEKCLREG